MGILDRDQPKPLYRQLTAALIERIASGDPGPGQRLPSARELQRIYGVSGIVVRQALTELQRQGRVFSVPGKGTFVAQPRVDKFLQAMDGFSEDMRRQHIVPSSIVLRADLIPAAGTLAEMLAVSDGTEIVALERMRLGDGIPMCVQVSYLPHSVCPSILRHDFSQLSLYQVLREEYDLRIARTRHCIRASVATKRQAELLDLPSASAVMWIDTWSYLSSGQVLEYGETAYRADRYEILSSTMQIPSDLHLQKTP
jgi:GntR family transcriptional regulator